MSAVGVSKVWVYLMCGPFKLVGLLKVWASHQPWATHHVSGAWALLLALPSPVVCRILDTLGIVILLNNKKLKLKYAYVSPYLNVAMYVGQYGKGGGPGQQPGTWHK